VMICLSVIFISWELVLFLYPFSWCLTTPKMISWIDNIFLLIREHVTLHQNLRMIKI
jgi:hypothetical protein